MYKNITLSAVAAAAMLLAGCAAVRTYTEEKERVDQVLTYGNQGYLAGQPKEGAIPKNRKMTRKTYVAEIEVGFAHKTQKNKPAVISSGGVKKEIAEEVAPEPILREESPAVTAEALKTTSYTVEPNDTLQKISQKVYGTAKKWKKIFDANNSRLKSPDRIYAGQVLEIPQE